MVDLQDSFVLLDLRPLVINDPAINWPDLPDFTREVSSVCECRSAGRGSGSRWPATGWKCAQHVRSASRVRVSHDVPLVVTY